MTRQYGCRPARAYLLPSAAAAILGALLVACSDRELDAPPPTPPPTTGVPRTTPTAARGATTPTGTPRAATPARPPVTPAPATARPTVTPAPSPPAAPVRGVILEHGDRAGREVALTFDLRGDPEAALETLEWLIEAQVPAAFFVSGEVLAGPDAAGAREVLRLAAAHPTLVTVGNLGYARANYLGLSAAEVGADLARAEKAVTGAAGPAMRPWSRPPLGAADDTVAAASAAAGYGYTVLWDVDATPPSDSGPGPGRERATDRVLGQVQGGSIIRVEFGGRGTVPSLPQVVDGLRERGLQPVTLAGLLAP